MPREISPRNERFYQARYNAGLTQAQLARATGTTRQAINAIERGKYRPSPELAGKIATVLNLYMEPAYLFEALLTDGEAA